MKKLLLLLPTFMLASPLISANTVLKMNFSSNSSTRYFDFPSKYLQTDTIYEEEEFSTTININDGTKLNIPNIDGWWEYKFKDMYPLSRKHEKWDFIEKRISDEESENINASDYDDVRVVPGYASGRGLKLALKIKNLNNLRSNLHPHLQNNQNEIITRIRDIISSKSKIELVSDISIELKTTKSYFAETVRYGRIFKYYYWWHVRNSDSSLDNISIRFKYKKPISLAHTNRKYQNPWNQWKNQILANSSFLTIDSDTGGNLKTTLSEEQQEKKFNSNKDSLDQRITQLNKDAADKNNPLKLGYMITSQDTIDLYLSKDNEFKEKLAENVKIDFKVTDRFKNQEFEKRLTINLGKWLDFEKNTTQLVDDKLVQDTSVKVVDKGKNRNAGRWIAHTPLSLSFNALKEETEVIKINGKKIDVLNQRFETTLTDRRRDSKDNEREFYYGYKPKEDNEEKTKENSHTKNEYKIEITKYIPGTGNKEVEFTWVKTLVIESRTSEMDFKWFAWDPENNPHQKALIEEYEKNSKGEIKRDEDGNPIKNPKYDPKIDPKTGTKKELVWFDFNTLPAWTKHLPETGQEYWNITHLPPGSKTLFAPHENENDIDRGVIAEAVVINKGALKEVSNGINGYRVHKLNEQGQFIEIEKDKLIENLDKVTTADSYYSTSGVWLFTSEVEKSITNFKIVYIVNSNEEKIPNGYFTDYMTKSLNTIKPLWQTKQGKRFRNYLLHQDLKEDKILNLRYEEALEYYKQYMNDLWFKNEWETYINIVPKFKPFNEELTVDEFKRKYVNNIKAFEDKYLDEFEHKNLVSVSKLEINDSKTGVYAYFNLKTSEIKYNLIPNKYLVLIKFKVIDNGNETDLSDKKHTINLNLDSEYIFNVARKSKKDKFIANLNNDKLFKNSQDDLNKLQISTTFSNLTNKLTIETDLKDEYKNSHTIEPNKTFSLIIDSFLTNEESKIDENIFSNVIFENINLGGIKEVEQAKRFIINKIKQALPNLTLDRDYRIRNLDIVVEKLKHPQTSISETNPIRYETLILEAIAPKFGNATIAVANTINRELDRDYDLSKKQLKDFEINENKLTELKKKIISEINKQFSQDGLVIDKDLEITNFNQGIQVLSLGKGNKFVFNITGLNNHRILNSTTVKVTNNANFVVDDEDPNYKPGDENNPDKAILYDLSTVKLELSFTDHVASQLRQKIINEIKSQLAKKYNLEYKKHYSINFDELNAIVRQLIQKNDLANTNTLNIYPIDRVTKNVGIIQINNTNKSLDPIDDTDKPIDDNDSSEEASRIVLKRRLLILVPLAILSLTGIGLISWFVYVRKFKKKIT
ncbi:Mbov_0399 family ICE element protein [Mycoplasma yeatsii]|uniref:Mbov_0399 family ICE element protein n=1 Tax=Mycoplasma yeatsii TaxID=51365 RepID=UPI0005B2430A|nr:hypothetical protein [Mycoplasma yeatsii]AJM71563.1 hypothetical protein MYE_00325 [Mycoplasma yeatsii GM274B]